MKKYLLFPAWLLFSATSYTQTKPNPILTEGATLLFKDTKSKLTIEEKNWLFKHINFTVSKDKKQFMSGEYEVAVQTYVTDINKDGKEEVFIVMHSGALFGNTGENFAMYMKNSKGLFEYRDELGGGIAMILASKSLGYPDMAIGGPGFKFPAYRWDGKKYKYFKDIKDADLQSKKVKVMDLAECSKQYADTIK